MAKTKVNGKKIEKITSCKPRVRIQCKDAYINNQGTEMSDDDGFWKALKEHKKEKFDADRKRFLEQAISNDDGGWTKHTEWHWSRIVDGNRLDYWPSRKKFQYKGKVMRGLKAMNNIKKT